MAMIGLAVVVLVALAGSSPEGGGCGDAEPARAQVDERSEGKEAAAQKKEELLTKLEEEKGKKAKA